MQLPLLPVSSMNNSWDQFNLLMGLKAHHTGYLKWTMQLHVPSCLVTRCSQARGSAVRQEGVSGLFTWQHLPLQLPYLEINHWMFTHGHFSLKCSVSHITMVVWHSLTSNLEVKECHVIEWLSDWVKIHEKFIGKCTVPSCHSLYRAKQISTYWPSCLLLDLQ